jgi:glutathione S-transferase
MLEELGQDYELREYQRNPRTMRAPPAMKELHPLGKSPVVSLEGRNLAESGAIIETLVERFDQAGAFRPEGAEAREQYLYWMHYAEGTLMPVFLVAVITNNLRKAKLPFFVKPIVKSIAGKIDAAYTDLEMNKQFAFVESHLGQHEYFAGDSFSAADVQMSYPVDAMALRGKLGARYPKAQAWLDRVKARPAYAAAVKRGGVNALPTMKH